MTSPQQNSRGKRFLVADDQGPRDEQQDSSICLSAPDDSTALLVVSDGVGGHSGGRLASQQVISVARKFWDERKGEFPDPHSDLAALSREAHNQIKAIGSREGTSPRATIVALYLTPSHAYWAHSGDSRLYHFQAGEMVGRTEDHSVLQILVAQGLVKEEDMGEHPDQGLLIQSLGGDEYKPTSLGSTEITTNDAFLLCTDGFWERTRVEEMAELLFSIRQQAPALLEQAVKRAVKRNGPNGDNVTVAVALPVAEPVPEVNGRGRPIETSARPKTGAPRALMLGGASLILGAMVLVGWFCLAALRTSVGQGRGKQSGNPPPANASATQSPAATPTPAASGK